MAKKKIVFEERRSAIGPRSFRVISLENVTRPPINEIITIDELDAIVAGEGIYAGHAIGDVTVRVQKPKGTR